MFDIQILEDPTAGRELLLESVRGATASVERRYLVCRLGHYDWLSMLDQSDSRLTRSSWLVAGLDVLRAIPDFEKARSRDWAALIDGKLNAGQPSGSLEPSDELFLRTGLGELAVEDPTLARSACRRLASVADGPVSNQSAAGALLARMLWVDLETQFAEAQLTAAAQKTFYSLIEVPGN